MTDSTVTPELQAEALSRLKDKLFFERLGDAAPSDFMVTVRYDDLAIVLAMSAAREHVAAQTGKGLLPCPFCMTHLEDWSGVHRHPANGCFVADKLVTKINREAWNTRAAREPVAAQTGEEVVERVAKAIHAVDTNWDDMEWSAVPKGARGAFLKYARAAIAALSTIDTGRVSQPPSDGNTAND